MIRAMWLRSMPVSMLGTSQYLALGKNPILIDTYSPVVIIPKRRLLQSEHSENQAALPPPPLPAKYP